MGWKAVLYTLAVLAMMLLLAGGKPLADKRGPPQPDPVEAGSKEDQEAPIRLEYDAYLRQIVEALESDEEFRKKLANANVSEIKSGAISMYLELVNHSVRNRLDEIKRMEVRRLQELALIRMKSMSGVGVNRMDIPTHLDLVNPHSFEMKDLENLIKKATKDVEELDKKRKEEFKTYEMEKEFEYQQKLNELPEDQRQQEEEKHKELQEKHKKHEKVNHPGSKDQFEEVWEKDDHLEDQDFDPKTFFMMHDLNGDLMWDIPEVESVLQRELDKVYDARNSPEEDDPNERFEEMSRMREHVFEEIDTNKDLMITMDEFLTYTGKSGQNAKFKEDEGWETLDENPQFTDDEYQEYIRQHHPDRITPRPEDLKFVPEGQQGMPQQQPGQFNAQAGQGQGQPGQGQGHPGQVQGQPAPGPGQPAHAQVPPGHGQGQPPAV